MLINEQINIPCILERNNPTIMVKHFIHLKRINLNGNPCKDLGINKQVPNLVKKLSPIEKVHQRAYSKTVRGCSKGKVVKKRLWVCFIFTSLASQVANNVSSHRNKEAHFVQRIWASHLGKK